MARRQHATRLETKANINITPLMDLTFLLLIVFMITAPMLEHVMDVTPPDMEAAAVDTETEPLVINVTEDGQIVCEDERLTTQQLRTTVQTFKQHSSAPRVLVRGDRRRPYGEMVDILQTVKKGGVTNIGLVTLPEEAEE